MILDGLVEVDPRKADMSGYRAHLADCIIRTHDDKILMQTRPGRGVGSALISTFGGHVEAGESVMQGLVRELHEELGAQVQSRDVLFLGAVSEAFTGHTELVHLHFWHDKEGCITGCYEYDPIYFYDVRRAFVYDGVMDYARWGLKVCEVRGLL